MSKILPKLNRQMQWAVVPLLLLAMNQQAWGQCNNISQYPSTNIDLSATNSSGVTTTITTCNFGGEYSVLINAVAGSSYRFTSSIATDYFTIRSGSPGGPVVGSGTQPLTVTPGVGGNLYAHINSSSACLTDVTCRQTAVQCTSCSGGGCINSNVYPSLNISLNPTNTSGAVQQITSCQFNGEYYSVIDVIAGKSYTFSSNVGTDWITVRVGTFNGSILGQGAGAVTVTPSTTASLFIHNNSNSSCGTGVVCRVSSVQCTNCLCQNGSQFPSTQVSLNPTNTSGTLQIVTACNFATEYFALANVLSPKNYTITSSVGTDWLTVRIGSPGGAVLAQGQTPLTITTTSTSDLYVHVNTNSSCGTSSACRITAVQCTNCSVPPPCVTSPTSPTNGQTNICTSATQTLSWPASPGATSYDVYFGTTNPPPFVGNTAATSYVATTPAAGTYYWQIRPVGPGGTASGCNVWSFTKQDNTAPLIVCKNTTVFIGSTGTYTLQPSDVFDAGASSDNCSGALMVTSILPATVGCNQLNQTISVSVTVQDGNGNPATCTALVTVQEGTTLPAGWSNTNVGNANGGAEYKACSIDGVFTVSANGFSTSSSDVLHFASRQLCGNGEIFARVTNVSGGGWAGIALRESLAPGSKKVALKTQLNSLIRREIRSTTNGAASILNFNRPQHVWLRLVRSGSNFIGYTSIDGTNWSFAFSATVSMAGCIYAGVFAESINVGTTTTASFTNVGIIGAQNTLAVNPSGGVGDLDGILPAMEVNVFPNPTSGEVNVNFANAPTGLVSIQVFNTLGESILLKETDGAGMTTERLDLSDLASGVYFITVKAAGYAPLTKRVMLTKSGLSGN